MKRSLITHAPRSNAGWIISRTCCARAANISSSSVSADDARVRVQQQVADPFGQRRAAGFARADDSTPLGQQRLAQRRQHGGLAGAFAAFELINRGMLCRRTRVTLPTALAR